MALADRIRIARRFLRSIRIDTDVGDIRALEGFVCSPSSTEVLSSMARHIFKTGQGAFTWTGPYGSGKSSLVVALSAFLNGDLVARRQATKLFGRDLANQLTKALPPGKKGWRIVPIVGRRDDPVQVIGEAFSSYRVVQRKPRGGWTESNIIATATEAATTASKEYGGLIIFIDEMGKFLEAAAQHSLDIYIFQQLAEIAARSDGRFVIVGILHQAFEEYAHRLSREIRDEWAKIQGRFIDIAINVASDEQIELISRTIECDYRPEKASSLALKVATLTRRDRPTDIQRLAQMLEFCWPLQPTVACLLGPMARRRFGQNQRSIFGFLNSAEPFGFQDFLRYAKEDEFYGPDRLWDYLRANLEPSILASPDGHRWALATEALERCEANGGNAVHIKLLKTVAIIDLFKERSGLVASREILKISLHDITFSDLKEALTQLENWSLIIFKKFLNAYAIFAGSDFDIEQASQAALERIDDIDFTALKSLAGLQPVLAKRHYHDTGALRWFDVNFVSACDVSEFAKRYQPQSGMIGQFLLIIPSEGESEEHLEKLGRLAARQDEGEQYNILGISKHSWAIVALAREIMALESVRNDRPELAGDAVARREVTARLVALQGQLEAELHKAFDDAVWFRKHYSPKPYRRVELNILASEIADKKFDQSPKIYNEILNRQKPSSNAVAAQNALLRRMVLHEGQEHLGIEGFPAERGLLASVLEAPGLYTLRSDGWQFSAPKENDSCRLHPMWKEAIDFVKTNAYRSVSVSEIYDLWRRPPFGVKDGLMPLLAVAFILTRRDKIALYRENIFRPRFDDVDIDYLVKNPDIIQIRWINFSGIVRRLLSEMASLVCAIDPSKELINHKPLDVARGLIAIYDNLPHWTKRTMRISTNAMWIRDLFKRAQDPNQFLFNDIPAAIGDGRTLTNEDDLRRTVDGVREGLDELVAAYPSMLHRLKELMLSELQVPNLSPRPLAELCERATNIRQIAGDFHLEAFAVRLSKFDDSFESFEGIASLVSNKPPHNWVDLDADRAAINIMEMAQKFLRIETYARVKGRPERRQSMAVMIGINGRPTPIHEEFDVVETDRPAINELIEQVTKVLNGTYTKQRSVILAVLAEFTARYIQDGGEIKSNIHVKNIS